jgi:exodeoxyribonuclease V alpha subunit
MATIRSHAADFIRIRLAPANPPNDGRQTPMRGHPVFKAQHATATCCRGCLEKWWKVPKGTEISPERQSRIVDFLMLWIERMQNTQQSGHS